MRVELAPGRLSDWVTLTFPAAPGIKVSGITRLLVIEMNDHFSLYMSPINIDPEKPAMPVSHPLYYATYLAKRIGPYSTLGPGGRHVGAQRRRDRRGTSSCSRPTTSIASARTCSSRRSAGCAEGALVCVFDATDRIQHMFWRYSTRIIRQRGARATPPSRRHPRSCTSTTTRWSAASWSSCARATC